jgi:lipopolysaccharide export system permease protein
MVFSPDRRNRGTHAMTGTLARYFGLRFASMLAGVLLGVYGLIVLLDYVEMTRRLSDAPNASAWMIAKISLFRVPQVAERILPFCILIGAMTCYLSLSRRLELVVSRAAGVSAWQFTAPAMIVALVVGLFATAVYNPVAALLHERSQISGNFDTARQGVYGFWVRQRSSDGQSIINAARSREQGVLLSTVTAFVFNQDNQFLERVEAASAVLRTGHWELEDARVHVPGTPPENRETYRLATNLTPAQVRETFSTPETVPFWQLAAFIDMAERAGLTASGYRLQYQKLLARPFLLASMVLLAAAFSLRFARFGGVQTMVLAGVASGFVIFALSKVVDDLSNAELLSPMAAAWLPVFVGGLTGFVVMLYQEDG